MTKMSAPRFTNIRSSMMRALIGQQQAVALLAGGQADHVHGNQRFERGSGIGPDQAQLAHVRHVEQAGGVARVVVFGHRPAGYCTGME